MTAPGRIVILNGAPRSGKSSIAHALQAAGAGAPGTWLNFGVDAMMGMTPEHVRPGIGLRPGGERPDLEPAVPHLYAGLFEAVAALSRTGLDVVSDLGIHDDYATSLGVWDDMRHRFKDLPVLTVGVLCDIDTIMARRNADPQGGFYAAGPEIPAPVRRWQTAVHAGKTYDLVVDTTSAAPQDCAALIAARLAGQ